MIGETDSTGFYVDENFAWHMIPWDHFTTVFRGEKTFPQGENVQIRFDFTEEFDYTGGNLVVFLVNDNETAYPSMDESGWFLGTSKLGNVVSLGAFDIDLANPVNDGTVNSSRPNTTFFFSEVSDASYNLTFNITDIAGNIVSDAVVKLNGTEYDAGQYTFEDLKPGNYAYTVTKNTATASGTAQVINEDVNIDVTLLDFSEIPGASGYLCEDFENLADGSRPFGWSGSFYVYPDSGMNGGKRISHSFWYLDGPRTLYTNPVFMGEAPVLEFYYRIMDMETQNLTYTGKPHSGAAVSWSLSVSTDYGTTWTELYSVDYGEHTPSTEYQLCSIDVSRYANEVCMFYLHVDRDNQSAESFYFDVDQFKAGTQLETDLHALSPLAGNRVASVNGESVFTAQVRNAGTQAASYTVNLMKGEETVATAQGAELASGAWASHELRYTPSAEGNETLYVVVETENDTYMANNTTTNLYVSVQPEGTRGEMVEDMEGRDICYVPFYFYTPYALNQTLYFSDETGLEAGEALTGIVYQTAFSKPLERQRVSVYVGETDQESLFLGSGAGMLPMNEMRLVFDGAIDISDVDGDNLAIEFQTPYQYGGRNLVVCTYQQSGQAAGTESDQLAFYGYYTLDRPVSSVYQFFDEPTDFENIDPAYNATNFSYPSTIFLTREGVEFHTVTFEVKDTEGKAIDNAVITFNGVEMEAGEYTVTGVADGSYAWAARVGDQLREGDVEVSGGDASVQVVFEPVSNEFNVEEDMIKVYPNPSTGKFYVEHAQSCKEIGIYDISGREVRRYTKVDAGVLEIDLSGCRDGLYLLMVDGKAFKITKR